MGKYSNELHITYQQGISAFLELYPIKDSDIVKEIDNFSRTCALALWYQFTDNVELCTEAINEIYTKETQRKIFTENQVKEAFGLLNNGTISIKEPEFFNDIINYDIEHGTNLSRRFASGMLMIFMTFLLIDEQISFEEVRMATRFHQVLVDMCDSKNINAYKIDFDPYSYITENEEKLLYHQKNTVKKTDNTITEPNSKSATEELNELIGLKTVKKEVDDIVNFATVQKMRKKICLKLLHRLIN